MHLETSINSISALSLEKIQGRISNYKKERKRANFFFTDSDEKIMGLAAIAGGLAGAAGQAAGNVRDAANLYEEADYVEMIINDQPVKGWVWFSPFKDGDLVEIVGTQKGSHFEAIAICRPVDRVISLYPHCSRGKIAHIITVIKWWLGLTTLGVGFLAFLDALDTFFSSSSTEYFIQTIEFFYATVAIYFLTGGIAYINGKRFMLFVKATTRVLKTLGIEDPDRTNLPKKTKRKSGDPGVLGVMYFKY